MFIVAISSSFTSIIIFFLCCSKSSGFHPPQPVPPMQFNIYRLSISVVCTGGLNLIISEHATCALYFIELSVMFVYIDEDDLRIDFGPIILWFTIELEF